MSIPKTIHYCWFGRNPMPKLAEKCINSWKKYCPNYDIIEWNEDNFDINACPEYVRQAYEAKKWAFVTDYARLKILYENGGIYFDTDVEIIKKLEFLQKERCFMCIEFAYDCNKVNTGLGLGSEKGFPLIKEMMDDYNDRLFIREDGSHDITTCTVINTEILKRHGFVEENRMQTVAGATVFPSEYFSPMDMNNGKMHKTKNTVAIHHYGLSWTTEEHRKERLEGIRRMRRQDFFYNLKVLPNNLIIKCLGKERYDSLKNRLKGKSNG